MNSIMRIEDEIVKASVLNNVKKVKFLKRRLLSICKENQVVYDYIVQNINKRVSRFDDNYEEEVKYIDIKNAEVKDEENIAFELGCEMDSWQIVSGDFEDLSCPLGYEVAEYYLEKMFRH